MAIKGSAIIEVVPDYLSYQRSVRNVSSATVEAYKSDLSTFGRWITDQNAAERDFTYEMIGQYIVHLNRSKLKNSSINRFLSSLKSLLQYLIIYRNTRSLVPIYRKIKLLKSKQTLPHVLSPEEIARMTSAEETFQGLRNTALIELLYSTGCRISEVVALNIEHIHTDITSVVVRGKGDKHREVYIGESARSALQRYLSARTQYLHERETERTSALFINLRGGRLSRRGADFVIKKIAQAHHLDHNVSAHSMRHSFATHILDNGADIRTVQELLGHSRVSTTQIYTHVGIAKLQRQHAAAHPHGDRRISKHREKT